MANTREPLKTIQLDDLEIGDEIRLTNRAGSVYQSLLYAGYERIGKWSKQPHCLIWIYNGHFIEIPVTHIKQMQLVEKSLSRPPVAEAACDFDPDELY